MDEDLSYGTSLKQQGRFNINVGLLRRITWSKRRTEDNVATPEVHQRGEDVLPLPT
jgi:hypothetical protein